MYNLIFLFVAVVAIILILLWLRSRQKPVNVGFCQMSDPYVKPFTVENLVTPEEAEHIIKTAKTRFSNSTIVSGNDESIRKSETAWLNKSEPVIKDIFERLSKQFKFNLKNVEDLQVVRYTPGGFYNEHHDSCCDDNDHCRDFAKKSGQRVLTILMYLNDEFEDGYTHFPNLDLHLKANKYGGIVFYPLELGGSRCHPNSLHKGTPVSSGTKYICNIWVREKEWIP
jgi:prolyl 4-hydroxylase